MVRSGPADRKILTAAQIEAETAKRNGILGRKAFLFDRVESTNDVALTLAREGQPEGTLVIAETQTAGKGRYDRMWFSPPHQGLWFSLILRPQTQQDKVALVMLLASLAMARAVEKALHLSPSIKWPNDVFLRGRKFCGILAASEFVRNQLAYVVLGVGVNVNQRLDDFPTELGRKVTSLRIETAETVDRAWFLGHVLVVVEELYLDFVRGDVDEALRAWEARCPMIGKNIQIRAGSGIVSGIFESIDHCGRARMRQADGHVLTVSSGEASLSQPRSIG